MDFELVGIISQDKHNRAILEWRDSPYSDPTGTFVLYRYIHLASVLAFSRAKSVKSYNLERVKCEWVPELRRLSEPLQLGSSSLSTRGFIMESRMRWGKKRKWRISGCKRNWYIARIVCHTQQGYPSLQWLRDHATNIYLRKYTFAEAEWNILGFELRHHSPIRSCDHWCSEL